MFYFDGETALAACVLKATTKTEVVDFFSRKKCMRVTWLEDFLTSKWSGSFTALAPPLDFYSGLVYDPNIQVNNLLCPQNWRLFDIFRPNLQTKFYSDRECSHVTNTETEVHKYEMYGICTLMAWIIYE